jgi:hypothetical protein
MNPEKFGSVECLNRRDEDRVRERATPPRGCVTLATWLAVVLGILLIALRAAQADDHAPLTCDPVCVVRYCESRCSGPHRDRLQGGADCKRECVRVVTERGCWPCKKGK